MEMKQKEQEINKRKRRLLWKEKRMKETVLNAMNPVCLLYTSDAADEL